MTKKKSTKRALISSLLILAMCFTMLAGTTFAWFTDSVTSANNIIKSGKLDMEVQYYDAGDPANNVAPSWKALGDTVKLFDDAALYEPGYTQVAYIKVKNVGTLALKYQLAANIVSETAGVSAAGEFKLSDYLMFGTVENADIYATREAARDAVSANAKALKELNANNAGDLLADAESGIIALVIYMPETVGNEANYTTTQPQIALGINVVATQKDYEADGFDDQYDAAAAFPGVTPVANAADVATAVAPLANAATAGDEPVSIALTEDVEDITGIVTQSGADLTVDLGNNELTVATPVGSTGTETLGMQVLKGSTVTLENGTFAPASSSVKMLINNYSTLNLKDVTLDGTNLNGTYTLSNNCGNVTISGNTNILTSGAGKVAFDLWYGMSPVYDEGIRVTFDDTFTGTVDGDIEYGAANAGAARNPDWKDSTVLVIKGNGTFNGQFKSGNTATIGADLAGANITVYSGNFKYEVPAAFLATGSTQAYDANTGYYVVTAA